MIKIHGVIGSYKDETGKLIKGVELVDVIAQVEKETSDNLVFEITSPGGLVDVGKAIRDYILSLIKDGKNVTTIANQLVASIATLPFLAGQTRQIVKGTDFLIHNPYVAAISGDADALAEYSRTLAAAEQEMAKYYSSVTGASATAMDLLMKEDKPMSTERAVELKFATEAIEGTLNSEFKNLQVVACINTPNMEIKGIVKQGKEMLKQIAALVAKAKGELKNLSVTTDDGRTLEVEGDTLKVGAMVTLDGQPTPSATYTLADGTKFTTDADSKITEITEPEAVEAKLGDLVYDKDDKEKLMIDSELTLNNGDKIKTGTKGQIIEIVPKAEQGDKSGLEKENEELKAAIEEMKENQEQTSEQIVALSKLVGSSYEPPTRKPIFAKKETDKKDEADVSGESIREKRKARQEKKDK